MADVELDVLYHFDPTDYITGAIFDSIYANTLDTMIISALRSDGWTDADIFDALCDGCVDSLMTNLFKFDYQGSLEWLQSSDGARFMVLRDLYAPDPPPPGMPLSPPEQITTIMANSSEANSVYQIGQSGLGHHCMTYSMLFDAVADFDTDDSRDVMTALGNFKACLNSEITDTEIAEALVNYLGFEAMWDQLLTYSADDEGDYLHLIRDYLPNQYLYYATLEVNTDVFMDAGVSFMNGPSIGNWLSAVQSRYGTDYYNELLEALADGNSNSYWQYRINEHHIYGSSRLGIEEQNKLLVEQPYYGNDFNYITEGGDSIILYDYSSDSIVYLYRGDKRYELSNPACRSSASAAAGRHLTNVLSSDNRQKDTNMWHGRGYVL